MFSSRDSGSRTPRLSSILIYQKDGHIHQHASPAGPYKNVSVEAINYTPVNIEELRIW
jgi:calcineurin-like phosphoesterase family protein